MGIRHIFLSMVLVAIMADNGEAAKTAPSPVCLSCHAVHYTRYGSCNLCHRGNLSSTRKGLAHSRLIMGRYASFRINGSTTLDFGRKLINQLACRRCHVIDGKGERRAANLDLLLANNDVSQIDAAISKPAFAMPDFRLDSSQRGMIITALFAGGSKNPQYSPERPLVVHFTPSAPKKKDPFTTHCGSCHKILTARGEVLGKGDIGPNLSALLSLNYPQNFPQGRSWTEERLLRWLTNPRAVRTNATMQPRRLSPEELRQLFILLDSQQQNN